MSFRSHFFFVALIAALPITAEAEFAALVYNDTTNNMGYSWEQPSQEKANESAMRGCTSRARGVGDCVVVIETQQCFSVFRYKGKDAWATGATQKEARLNAKAACEDKFGAKCRRVTYRCAN